jgi:hypothetical protein
MSFADGLCSTFDRNLNPRPGRTGTCFAATRVAASVYRPELWPPGTTGLLAIGAARAATLLSSVWILIEVKGLYAAIPAKVTFQPFA